MVSAHGFPSVGLTVVDGSVLWSALRHENGTDPRTWKESRDKACITAFIHAFTLGAESLDDGRAAGELPAYHRSLKAGRMPQVRIPTPNHRHTVMLSV